MVEVRHRSVLWCSAANCAGCGNQLYKHHYNLDSTGYRREVGTHTLICTIIVVCRIFNVVPHFEEAGDATRLTQGICLGRTLLTGVSGLQPDTSKSFQYIVWVGYSVSPHVS